MVVFAQKLRYRTFQNDFNLKTQTHNSMKITFEQLKQIVPTLPKNGDVFIPYLNEIIHSHKINTPKRMSAFISNFAHETMGFSKLREMASGAAYDVGRKAIELGNTPEDDGDGEFYKGRGGFQITGKANYQKCSRALFGDDRLLKTPELLETPQYAVKASAWFFVEVKGNSLMDLPDTWRSKTKNYSPYQYLVYRINAALLHYDKRKAYYDVALKVLS